MLYSIRLGLIPVWKTTHRVLTGNPGIIPLEMCLKAQSSSSLSFPIFQLPNFLSFQLSSDYTDIPYPAWEQYLYAKKKKPQVVLFALYVGLRPVLVSQSPPLNICLVVVLSTECHATLNHISENINSLLCAISKNQTLIGRGWVPLFAEDVLIDSKRQRKIWP